MFLELFNFEKIYLRFINVCREQNTHVFDFEGFTSNRNRRVVMFFMWIEKY
jgi:hypothetical protein